MINYLKNIKEEFLPEFRAFRAVRDSFYEDLADAVVDGDSLQDFLESQLNFCLEHRQKKIGKAYRVMLARLEEQGGRLSYLLDGIVPDDDLVNLAGIDRANQQKDTARSLKYLADLVRLQNQTKSAALKSVMSPLMVGPVIIAFLCVVALAFVPEYEAQLSHERWPLIGKMLYWISQAIRYGWYVMIVASAMGLYLFVKSFSNWMSPLRRKLDNHIPYRIYRDRQTATFLGSMVSLMDAGVQLSEALENVREKASPWLNWHVNRILINLDEHPDDYGKVFATGIFSPEVHQRLSNYARRAKSANTEGSEEDTLTKLSVAAIQKTKKDIDKSSARIAVWCAYLTAGTMVFIYGANFAINSAVRSEMKKQADEVAVQTQSK